MATGSLAPVPPVQHLPADLRGAPLLVLGEPTIESADPTDAMRAREKNVPHDYREAMLEALRLAGFRVLTTGSPPHDAVARLALVVVEDGDRVQQTYRCTLTRPDGSPLAQVDWRWPEGTYVAEPEVLEFAAHNLATEIVRTGGVVRELARARQERGRAASSAPSE